MEIQLWRNLLCPYELAVQELVIKFEHLIEEHLEDYPENTSPVQGEVGSGV